MDWVGSQCLWLGLTGCKEDLKRMDLELLAYGLNVAQQFGDVDECPSASGKWAPVWEIQEWI
jgi:hypothetical protein